MEGSGDWFQKAQAIWPSLTRDQYQRALEATVGRTARQITGSEEFWRCLTAELAKIVGESAAEEER